MADSKTKAETKSAKSETKSTKIRSDKPKSPESKTTPTKAKAETASSAGPKKKEAVHPAVAAAPTPVPAQINDRREDDAPVLGHFVDVVSGEHEGRYGVFETLNHDEKTAVVRSRDAESERLVVKLSDLRPAEAGRR